MHMLVDGWDIWQDIKLTRVRKWDAHGYLKTFLLCRCFFGKFACTNSTIQPEFFFCKFASIGTCFEKVQKPKQELRPPDNRKKSNRDRAAYSGIHFAATAMRRRRRRQPAAYSIAVRSAAVKRKTYTHCAFPATCQAVRYSASSSHPKPESKKASRQMVNERMRWAP